MAYKSLEDAIDNEATRASGGAAWGSPAFRKAWGKAVKKVTRTWKFPKARAKW